ncbi:MAG TPA: SGNH/GDSL hydrolase family protein [Mycobacteriales bacterium]|nr:SGNH/GDSL hydrolase family protein [Mycobacteriales bacterium]
MKDHPRALAAAWRGVLAGGVDPAEVRQVIGERLVLPAEEPDAWRSGRPLRGVRTETRGQDGTPAPGALDPASVTVHSGLDLGRHYLVDEHWGTLGAPVERQVSVDYRYSLLRVDSIIETERVALVRGRSHLTAPLPPPLPAGARRLANVFVPYFSNGRDYDVFPVSEPDRQSSSTVDMLPRFAAKLSRRQPVKVVCWGDSVTEGGDSSSEQTAYPAVLSRLLRAAHPDVRIELTAVAVGGSNSTQWLGEEPRCDWERVAAEHPDLVTVEFVNDAGLAESAWEETYLEIVSRIRALGAEPLLTTPHFTMPAMMGIDDLRAADPRPYVRFIRDFAARQRIALADVSARWERLASEGLPYITLLANAINHPDDRGHALAADELFRSLT